MNPAPIVVVVPVQNAEVPLGACLEALALQSRKFDRLVLFLHGCTDGSLEVCNSFFARQQNIEIIEAAEPVVPEEARFLALQHAAAQGPNSIILTTDADAILERMWIEKNLQQIAKGAQVVCGVVKIDPLDGDISHALQLNEMRERVFLDALDEIANLVDPDPNDPWPRHHQQSGASLALTREIFALANAGLPPATDQALIERLRLVDARIRHASDIVVNISGRLMQPKAAKRRLSPQEALTDEKLEPAIDALRRATAQARVRAARQGLGDACALAQDLLIPPAEMLRMLEVRYHGQAWAAVQAASPVLRSRRRVALAGLARETRIALELRDRLRIENQTAHGVLYATRPDA